MSEERAHESLQPQLVAIVQKVLAKHSDFEALFGMPHFLPLLDLFDGEAKVDASRSLVAAFNRLEGPVADPVVVSAMVNICKVNKYLLSLCLISFFVRKYSWGFLII